MERWCPVVLLVLCSVVFALNGVEAVDDRFDDNCCTYFYYRDVDGDLRLSPTDLQEFYGRILCSELNITAEGFRRKAAQLAALADQAPRFFTAADESLSDDFLTNGVGLGEFRTSMKARRNTTELKRTIGNMVTFNLKVFNEDGDDNRWTVNEFATKYRVFGFVMPNPKQILTYLDKDGDGFLSWEEINRVAMEYFNQAANPYNLWGGAPYLTCDEVAKRNTSA